MFHLQEAFFFSNIRLPSVFFTHSDTSVASAVRRALIEQRLTNWYSFSVIAFAVQS
jgi:hypothetical protein